MEGGEEDELNGRKLLEVLWFSGIGIEIGIIAVIKKIGFWNRFSTQNQTQNPGAIVPQNKVRSGLPSPCC